MTTKYDSIVPVFVPEPIEKFGCEMTFEGKTYIGVLDHWAAVQGTAMSMQIVTEVFLINQLNTGLKRRYLIALRGQITDAIKDRHAKVSELQKGK